jgi:hypothetical protein
MDFACTYRVNVFAAPEQSGFCVVAMRGGTVVGVAWGDTKLAALRVMRRRVRGRRRAASQVRELMAALSEREFFASWHLGLEHWLYQRAFATGVLEPELATLRRSAETVGVWWVWPEHVVDGPVCVPIEEAHRTFGGARCARKVEP